MLVVYYKDHSLRICIVKDMLSIFQDMPKLGITIGGIKNKVVKEEVLCISGVSVSVSCVAWL